MTVAHIARRTYVLHSGGIDSSTALAKAIRDSDTFDEVISVSVNYGQRHLKEIDYANQLAAHLSIERLIVDMSRPPKSMLTDSHAAVPEMSYADIQGMSPTYVPFRNGQLLSRVAGVAQGWILKGTNEPREATIWFGAHAEDAHNWAYPDCTPEFIGAMANAIYIGTYFKVRLVAPFMHYSKSQIVTEGFKLKVPYEMTWSCYKGEELHCGKCPTCIARKEAFVTAAVYDPTRYAA
jgi:7-cyano-7-deazaguanine synthase